jgi:hypothetical protein
MSINRHGRRRGCDRRRRHARLSEIYPSHCHSLTRPTEETCFPHFPLQDRPACVTDHPSNGALGHRTNTSLQGVSIVAGYVLPPRETFTKARIEGLPGFDE